MNWIWARFARRGDPGVRVKGVFEPSMAGVIDTPAVASISLASATESCAGGAAVRGAGSEVCGLGMSCPAPPWEVPLKTRTRGTLVERVRSLDVLVGSAPRPWTRNTVAPTRTIPHANV